MTSRGRNQGKVKVLTDYREYVYDYRKNEWIPYGEITTEDGYESRTGAFLYFGVGKNIVVYEKVAFFIEPYFYICGSKKDEHSGATYHYSDGTSVTGQNQTTFYGIKAGVTFNK